MANDSLQDETVKLVSYNIVSIKPGEERVLPFGSNAVIITDSISEETFITWIIARYLQSKEYAALSDGEKLSDEDRKYLRVNYGVGKRWSREPYEFEERQVRVLGEIRDEL